MSRDKKNDIFITHNLFPSMALANMYNLLDTLDCGLEAQSHSNDTPSLDDFIANLMLFFKVIR